MASTVQSLPWEVQVGRVWFQWRSFSPLPFFLLMLFLPPDFVLESGARALVLAGILASEAVRIWAVGYAGSATRTRGDSVPQLVHAGPFRYLRNPLYVANLGLYALAGVFFGFGALSVVLFVFSVIEYVFIVSFEEHVLRETFGVSYETYCRRVNRWLPSLIPRIESSPHSFSLSQALKSEKSTFFSISALTALFFLKSKLH